jgi:hypothetical protein
VLQGILRATIGLLASTAAAVGAGQPPAPPPQFFVVCASQANLPTVYFSGVLQGPATAFQDFRAGFTDYLTQQYSYQGPVACWPTNNGANAQNFMNAKAAALRNAKRTVVETGWSESAAAAALAAAAAHATAPTVAKTQAEKGPATAGGAGGKAAGHPATGAGSAGGAGSDAGSSQLMGLLNSVFGGGTAGCGATGAAPAKGSGSKSAGGSSGAAAGASAAGCTNTAGDVTNTLTTAFNAAAASGPGGGHGSGQAGKPPDGLGSGEAQGTKLVVYGCGRQDTQVACATELTNENQKETLVRAADVWSDAFIVDDRGDRHVRSSGFFLNVDGEQRAQLDIAYGKSAKFILMFSDVETRVQKVALRSTTGGLDVEDIGLISTGAAAKTAQQ